MQLNINRARHLLSGKTEKINFSIDILELEWEYNRLWSLSILPKNRFIKNKSRTWGMFFYVLIFP
nr:antimicrobial resistance protein Mig-14 [Salmonella sp. NCTC 7297]